MTNMTCGSAGGAISMWINVIECRIGRIVSSLQSSGTTGSEIYCANGYIGYETHIFTNIPHKLEKYNELSC